MGNSPSGEKDKEVTEEQLNEFCSKIRPLDLLVFQGSEGVSRLIRKLERKETGDGEISHVEVAITKEWCPSITLIKKHFEAFPDYEGFSPHPQYQLSWGSELSGKLNDGVFNAETGGVTFGVQFRDLKELVRKYASRKGANVGVCRLKDNPIEKILGGDPEGEAAKALKKKLCEAYEKYKGCTYNYNFLDLLAALYPSLRDERDAVRKLLKPFLKGKKEFLFCSEFAASLYKDLGIINDDTDGKDDGVVLDPANVVPVDFLGHDQDTEGIRVRLCEPPIWIK